MNRFPNIKTGILQALLLTSLSLAHRSQARADVLAVTQTDFSLAAQGTAGFQYGYYTEANSTAGTFSTEGMSSNGSEWRGTLGFSLPAHSSTWMHPGAGPLLPVVRRYTVGSPGEPSFTGAIRITGRFNGNTPTNRFVTVNGTTVFLQNVANGESTFDVTASVTDDSTIDLGVAPGADGNSDLVTLEATILPADTAVPTKLVGSAYNSPGDRAACLALATDGVLGSSDAQTFDTGAVAAFPYQFAGLFYGEAAGSGRATRLDSVRVDVTTANDFAGVPWDAPRVYVLRVNSDPNTRNPAGDDRYVRLPIVPVRTAANSVGQPYYTFDLTSLPAGERTGYGFAVVGAGANKDTPIAFSEVSAAASRVADSAVIAPQPFFVSIGGHRYARSVAHGTWEQIKTDALNFGGNLVQLEDAAENQLMVDTFGGTETLFIGLHKDPAANPYDSASYKWTTGATSSTPLGAYQNWFPGQPDSFGGKNDYVEMNYTDGAPGSGAGKWSNMGNEGYPETSDYSGIIELPTPGAGLLNFQLGNISARSNIFDAGLTSPTQGGVLPPSINVSGLAGGTVTFPQVVGTINTFVDLHGPDGAHTSGRSCDLTAVGGISGYRNGNNTPALVGVFLGSSQPSSPPLTLDFSASQFGENFLTLSPDLGQVFFIGDGFTSNGVMQQFIIPAGATKLYFGIPDGNDGTLYHGAPAFYNDNDGVVSVRAVVTAVVEADIIVEQPEGSPRESGVGTVAFGTSNVNTPVVRTFTIKNSAAATNSLHLTGTKPTIDGTNSVEFTVSDYSSTSLAPGASATVDVTFTPTAGGTRTAALHIGSDDADENPFDVALSGVGFLPPEIAVSETDGPDLVSSTGTVLFGTSLVGTPVVKTFTIRNSATATGALHLTGVKPTVDGTDHAEFVAGDYASTTVLPGESTTVTLTFTPTAAGTRSAALHIGSDDADENPFDIALSGDGGIPQDIAVSETGGPDLVSGTGTVLFGTSLVGTPVVKTFTIRNSATATGALHLTGVKPTVDGTNNAEFVAGDYASATVLPGESTTVTVTFTPTAAGTRTSALHIGSDDADENPFDIALSGDGGIPPEIAVSETGGPDLTSGSSTVAFGSTVSGAGLVREFTITNSGVGQLNNVAASIDGVDSSSFTVTAPPSTTVAASGGTTQLTVRFAAGSPDGAKTATLHIESDDADENPFDITLTGSTTGTVINGTFNGPGDVPLTVADLTATGLTLNLTLGFAPTVGTDLTLVNNTGAAPITGTFAGLPQGAPITLNYGGQDYEFTLTYTGGTGNDIVLLWPSPTSTPTHLVGSAYNSPNDRTQCFTLATDGVFGSGDALTFDTGSDAAFPFQFAGLLYLENPGTGKAARIDSVRVDVTTTNDFADVPRVYLLRHNSDPNTSNPAADDRYARLPVVPVRAAANSAGQPYYTFDLTTLGTAQRTGYGFAVVGSSVNASTPVVFSEVSAVAARVADTAVIAPQPFLVSGPDNHRYGWSITRGDWDQAETSAIAAGGHLVTINDAIEQSYLVSQFGAENVFIGLKQDGAEADMEPGGGWRWRTGELLSDPGAFLNWNAGEPNGYEGPDEDYGFMNFATPGTWGDVRVMGFPPAQYNTFRGIIEVPTAGSGALNFIIASVPATSNIFGAGVGSPPGGGSLPPSIDVSGFDGQQIAFPQIVGVIDTAADRGGPDGPHTPGRSCDLTAVGGISGYRNDNNTPALVGVFLGASQPSSPPVTLDFSANARGENFTALSPELGQVFFIGDGFTTDGVMQQFIVPAGATKLYFGLPDGNDGTLYHGTPLGWSDNSGSVSLRATIIPSASPTITNVEFPLHGGQLEIFGGTGPYTVTVTGGSLPPGMILSATGLVSGTVANGTYLFTLHVVDSLGASSDRSFTLVIENAVPVPQGILAWWPGEGAAGDVIGGYHGSLRNGATYGAGEVDRAFSFDGFDDLMLVPGSGSLNLSGDFTIEAWIKPTASTTDDQTIIGKRSGDGQNVPFEVYLDPGGHLGFATRAGGLWNRVSAPATSLSLNVWHHIAVVASGAELDLMVDGSVANTSSVGARGPDVTEALAIGASITTANPETDPLNPFSGLIDELGIYNRALTPAAITDLYNAGTKGKARHDVARDYSATTNNGPVWSYRWIPSTDVDSAYDPTAANTRLLSGPNAINGGVSSWGNNPAVTYNTTDTEIPGSYSWTPRQFGMHPGPSNEYAVLRWKAPQAGHFAVSATFYGADNHPTTTDVHIFHNATQLTPADKRLVDSWRGDGVSHTQIISVVENDTVDFLVGPGGNGYSSDSTGLAASIAEVVPVDGPEIDIEQPIGTLLVDASSTVNFGSTSLFTPVTLDFTVTNAGTTLLTLGNPSADGDFTVGPLGDATLDPAQSTTLSVTFTPSASGLRTGTLHILSDDADEASFDISLTGTGTPPATAGNAVFGWGQNINGTIGDGTTTNRSTAVPAIMTGALAGKQVISVTAEIVHSLALTDDGKIFAWGLNTSGQLGDGSTTQRTEPVAVDMSGALNGKFVIACEAGVSYSLALTSDGRVYSWGYNGFGELGLGDTTSRSTPQLVQGALAGKNVVSISAGPFHAMALTSDGEVYGWGANASGELGDGTTTSRSSPVALVQTGTLLAGKTIRTILCAFGHTVVNTTDNLVFAWGGNSSAQLGDGTLTNRLQPVAVNGALAGQSVVEIAGHQSSHLARTSDGLLYSWGANSEGQLGDGTKTARLSPVAVTMSGALTDKSVSSIHMGGGSALVRTSDNLLYTWGSNGNGALGVGASPAESLVPVAVDASGSLAGKAIIACSLESNHALVVAYTPSPDAPAVFGWGENLAGKIGDGTTTTRFTAVRAVMTGALAGKQVASVVAGLSQSLALSEDGKLYAWGLNTYGELGDGTTTSRSAPVAVNMSGALNGKVVTACATGIQYSLALTSEGKVYSWGANDFGELGLGDTTPRSTPQLVQGMLSGKSVVAISAGSYHAMALTSDGEVYGWGLNGYGQLLDGTTATRLSPVALVKSGTLLAGKTISSVLCAFHNTFVRTSDGLLFAWGWNGGGLGDGTTTDRLQPVAITGALGGKAVVEIAGPHDSHLARTSDGLLYGWGVNFHGELGDGSATPRLAPVPVDMSGALSGKTVVSIQLGVGSALARTADNRLYSWGGNSVGQLGVGNSPAESHVPVAVNTSGGLAGKTIIACSLQGYHALVIGYTTPRPALDVISSGALAHTDGSTRDFGTKFVGDSTADTVVFTLQNVGTAPLTGFSGANGITIDGANAAAFSLSGTVPASLEPGASTSISVAFHPLAQGAHEAWLHIHSNDPDKEPFDIRLVGTGGMPITDWRQQHFATTDNTGNAADDADPDGDGLSNLLEFATGADPSDSNAPDQALEVPAADQVVFRYARNKLAMAELNFTVEWNDMLAANPWSSFGVSETIISDDGTTQQVEARLPTGGNDQRFVRLKVTRP